MTLLTVWLITGHLMTTVVPEADCRRHLELGTAAAIAGALVTFSEELTDGQIREVPIVRMDCAGRSVVLALPQSNQPCDMEAGS